MIVSHKHKFIFIKTEKTAGTSFEIALSKICGPEDIITPISKKDENYRKTLGYRGAQNYHFPISDYQLSDFLTLFRSRWHRKHKLGFYNHMPASLIKPRVGDEVWNDYFKFCFERNPYDKFVSWYYWMNKNNRYPSMQAFIESGDAGIVRGRSLYTLDDEIAVDRIFKFEEINEAIGILNERFGLHGQLEMPGKNTKSGIRSEKAHYRDLLGPFEKSWIEENDKDLLARLDYSY